jgi:hypothetical protein
VDVILPLETVLCRSQLLQLSRVDILVVFFHPVLDRLGTLPSVDQNTCTGDVVHIRSSHVFQAILKRTKEAGDLPWWQASTKLYPDSVLLMQLNIIWEEVCKLTKVWSFCSQATLPSGWRAW